MRSKNAASLLFLLLFIFQLSTGLFSQESGGNAIVVAMKGEASYIGANTVNLSTGTVINTNDSIYMLPGSTLTVLEEDGSIKNYGRSFRVPGIEKRDTLLHQLLHQSMKYVDWLASVKKGTRNHARAGSENDMFMLFPRNTKLTRPPERLTWKASAEPDTKFEVALRCYENDFSYDELTKNENIVLGTGVPIVCSKQYYWFVRKTNTDLSEIPSAVWFSVLSKQDIEKLETEKKTLISIMHQDTMSVAFQLLYANLLMSYELYEECRNVLNAASAVEPRNPVVQTFYAVIFDKMEMVRESQKYIEYSDQIGR